ncbi:MULTISPECIES: hypothetical protein [Citrobacter]|uniref:hypothetical protein n=1 Tax=Citrobacter TaxID=544 RepID=UPI001C0FFC28|nr:hypothetical protein [Citrobacter sp. S55_ASV_140]MBU5603234.1 hypothetical protein [Citrobacter sp. S55_ASV_140]
MNTKIASTSYTAKGGYVWRKRFDKSTLSITLQTRDHNDGLRRATLMNMKFLEYKSASIGKFEAMNILMKDYRDTIVKADLMAGYHATLASLNVDVSNSAIPIPAVAQVAAVELKAAQLAVEADPRHTFEEGKTAYIEHNSQWKVATGRAFASLVNRFLGWAAANHNRYVEDMTHEHVILFKSWMDSCEEIKTQAIKNQYITRLYAMFTFFMDIKRWIKDNPFRGIVSIPHNRAIHI